MVPSLLPLLPFSVFPSPFPLRPRHKFQKWKDNAEKNASDANWQFQQLKGPGGPLRSRGGSTLTWFFFCVATRNWGVWWRERKGEKDEKGEASSLVISPHSRPPRSRLAATSCQCRVPRPGDVAAQMEQFFVFLKQMENTSFSFLTTSSLFLFALLSDTTLTTAGSLKNSQAHGRQKESRPWPPRYPDLDLFNSESTESAPSSPRLPIPNHHVHVHCNLTPNVDSWMTRKLDECKPRIRGRPNVWQPSSNGHLNVWKVFVK